ncbi:MAG: alpha/beta fold hydrolase [Desulfuromonadaceae bacterium]|nr:alpha/beta fold hydrolase [Desulfuromonadaceae bacterium]
MILWLSIAIVLALATIALSVLAGRHARRLLSHSRNSRQRRYAENLDSHPRQILQQHKLDTRLILLTSVDGFQIHSWWQPATNGATILLLHGYKMDCGEMIPAAAMLTRHGFGVLLVNIRAHGDSDGEQIRFGAVEWQDIAAGVEFILEQSPHERIGLLGNSMGGALSLCYAGRDERIAAVAAQSPYASVRHSLKRGVKRFTGLPAFPFVPLIRLHSRKVVDLDAQDISPLEMIRAIAPRPILLMMGGCDSVVEPSGIFALQQVAGNNCELWYEPELEHVAFQTERAEEFERRLVAFFSHHLLEM